MRHQDLRPGMFVSLRGEGRERYGDVDLSGNPIPMGAYVRDMWCDEGRNEPWIALTGALGRVDGAFRAKDLCCGACGGSGRGRNSCPSCRNQETYR